MRKIVELLRFDGRLSRIGFWRGYLSLAILGAGVWVAALFAILAIGKAAGILLLLLLPVVVGSVAIIVRRLHDRDRTGWWVVPFGVFPAMISVWAASEAPSAHLGAAAQWAMLLVTLAAFVFNIWGLVEIGFRRGTVGENRYGIDPA